MQSIIFDHAFSVCRNNDLKLTLETFRAQGFTPDPEIVQHTFGNNSGFLSFTGTYLEFLSFYDRSLWNAKQDADVEVMVNAHRPYGLGLRCQDSEEVYRRVLHHFQDSEPAFSRGKKNESDSRPVWSFFKFPKNALPGASCFTVQYLDTPTERAKMLLRNSLNSCFFIGGYVFCTPDPLIRVAEWTRTLALFTEVAKIGPNKIGVGAQVLEWIGPGEYEKRFGVPWVKLNSVFAEVAAVKIYCQDLAKVEEYLGRAAVEAVLCVPPDENTGFAFQIEERLPDELLASLRQADP